MSEKPVIIVTGKAPNMQSWYEENADVPWKNWPIWPTPSAVRGIPPTVAGPPKRKKSKHTCSTPCAWC